MSNNYLQVANHNNCLQAAKNWQYIWELFVLE
jgi:7-keto-8-aminopelargonate synthetase-like enzyme